jgi:autotransporter-associated beta strand protein
MAWLNSRRRPQNRSGRRPGASRKPQVECLESRLLLSWNGYAGNPQHTAVSSVASQALQTIHWETPVDLNPQYSGNDLFIHYGSPLVTNANTVIVPVKTGATNGFQVEAINGGTGAVKWTQTTDYLLPPHDWTPSYGPTLTSSGRLYFAGAGGTVYYVNNADTGGTVTQLAFYGLSNYTANPTLYNNNVFINTPITADSAGTIYFGFMVLNSSTTHLLGGLARIAADGNATYTAAQQIANDSSMNKLVHNCAPALSNDGQNLYVAVNNGNGTTNGAAGQLIEVNATNLGTMARVRLKDVKIPTNDASLPDDGSASPMVGPDGDVYFGVLENDGQYASKGWMLHFSSNLSQLKTAGAFGWDDTASIVDHSLVPSYAGSSSYLLMTKYNNYADFNLDGINKIAILDPNATQVDSRTGATVMKEVLTIAGPTPDPNFRPAHPNAVREWCINDAVVDPATKSVLANSEDGKLYRWDLTTNTFTQVVTLTPGIGEAYTPTVIGQDGTVYAINNATLFAVGAGPAAVYVSQQWNFDFAGSDSTHPLVGATVDNRDDHGGTPTWTAIYGTTAFGTISTGSTTGSVAGDTTIQSAINAATTGAVLTVDNGTYHETLTLRVSLTLQGQSQAGVILAPVVGGGSSQVGMSTTVSNVTIQNLTINGQGASDNFAKAILVSTPQVAIDNTTLTSTQVDVEIDTGGTVISLHNNTFAKSVQVNGGTLAIGTENDAVQGLTLFSGSVTGTGTLTSATDYFMVTGTVSAILAGSVGLTKTASSSAVTLSATNTYTGATNINEGSLQLVAPNAIASSSSVSVPNIATLDITGAPGGGPQTVNQLSGVSGSIINLGLNTLTVNTNSPTTFAGNINSTNPFATGGGLTLISTATPSTLTLSGSNTYVGATFIENGTLLLGSSTALPSGSAVQMLHSASSTVFPTLDLGGFSATAKALLSVNAAGTVQSSAGFESLLLHNQTLTLGSAQNASSLFSGIVTGVSGSRLVKQGTGTLYLFNPTDASTFSGGITVSAGYVIAGTDGALGAAGADGITVQAGASLTFAKHLVYNTAEPVTINGNGVVVSGYNSGALQGNYATFAGPITLGSNSTILATGNDTNPPTPSFTLSGAVHLATFTLTSGGHYSDNLVISGAIDGTGSVTTLGATGFTPRTILSGSDTFTGPTTVASGTVVTVDGSTADNVTVNAGGLLNGNGTIDGNTAILGTLKPGDPDINNGIGTLSSPNAMDFSGGGTLLVNIRGTSGSPQMDALSLGGGLTVGGTSKLVVDLSGLSSLGTTNQVTYTIVTTGAAGITGGDFSSTMFQNIGSHNPAGLSHTTGTTSVTVTVGDVGSSWAGSTPGTPGALSPVSPADSGQLVTVAVLDTGLDFSNRAALPNIWINQDEIPASVRGNLVDVYHDGFISFRDLQDPINQGPGKIVDSFGDGYISVRDLLAPIAQGGWATGQVDPTDGLVDDIVGWNFVDNNNNPYDQSGHGTYSANLVNQVDPNAVIMPLQVLGANGIGSLANATAALNYAVAHGAQITLDAWVPFDMTQGWIDAVNAAQAQGVLVITAAGNDNAPALDNLAQAHASNVVIVGAVDSNNQVAPFSNSGASVDLTAPGVNVLGLVTGGRYEVHSGTSAAAAQVAGAAALTWGLHPTLTDAQVESALLGGADQVQNLTGDVAQGRVLNIGGTLTAAAQLYQSGILPTPPQALAAGALTVPAVPVNASSISGALPLTRTILLSPPMGATAYLQVASYQPGFAQSPAPLAAPAPEGSGGQQLIDNEVIWYATGPQGSNLLASFASTASTPEDGAWDTLASLTDNTPSDKA